MTRDLWPSGSWGRAARGRPRGGRGEAGLGRRRRRRRRPGGGAGHGRPLPLRGRCWCSGSVSSRPRSRASRGTWRTCGTCGGTPSPRQRRWTARRRDDVRARSRGTAGRARQAAAVAHFQVSDPTERNREQLAKVAAHRDALARDVDQRLCDERETVARLAAYDRKRTAASTSTRENRGCIIRRHRYVWTTSARCGSGFVGRFGPSRAGVVRTSSRRYRCMFGRGTWPSVAG